MNKEIVMNSITLVWLVCLFGVVALAVLYWRYTSCATSSLSISTFDIEDVIFIAQILFVVWLALNETFQLMSLYTTSQMTIW